MPSTNREYGKSWGKTNLFEDLECPSGELCQVRKPNPRQLVALGLLDKFDALSKLIDDKHIQRVTGKAAAKMVVDKLQGDPQAVMGIMEMADRIVEYAVVQPVLRRPVKSNPNPRPDSPSEVPLPADEREKDVVYTDMVDENDKMYIFMYSIGGGNDLESFRKSVAELSGSVGDVESVARPAKRVSRPRK